MSYKLILCLLFFGPYFIHGANIFAVFPYQAKSHNHLAENLLKRLSDRGHNVDFVTHCPSIHNLPRYREISLAGSLPLFENNVSVYQFEELSTYGMTKFVAIDAGVKACIAMFNTSSVKNLMKTRKKYDLVITHIFGTDCALGFSHVFKAPIISIVTADLPWGGERIGNPNNPAYFPNFFSSTTSNMNFYERLKNTVTWIITRSVYRFFSLDESNRIAKSFFGPNTPDISTLVQNTSIIFGTTHYSMNGAKPAVPNYIDLGGLHIDAPKKLSKHFENIITENHNGVIYVSMGSMIMIETFEFRKLQGMFDAFAELPYKILWKADPKKFPKSLNIPKNVHFEKWMPQIDILCHPNVKLFVTHGGLFGSQESVYCGVPRLGIPLFADQESNIRASEKTGIAIRVGYTEITKESMLRAATKLLQDTTYKEKVEGISKIFRDRPIPPSESVIYWIEYVLKYKGAPYLRSVAADVSWYHFYLIDVVFVVFLMLLSLFFIVIFIVKLVISNLKNRMR